MTKALQPSFTQAEYEKARSVNILSYLEQNGYEIEKSGREFQLNIHDSLKITPSGSWYWHSRKTGGQSPIELLKRLENIGTVEAVKRLCGKAYTIRAPCESSEEKPPKPFELPPRNKSSKRVFAYLNITRCIDAEIISHYMKQQKIYESADHNNAVFVAYDKDGVARYAALRGTSTYGKPFRRDVEGSDKSYPFALEGQNNRLYLFESAVDALSHASLFKMKGLPWQIDHRISLNGISNDPLPRYLRVHPNITDLIFCLDNDNHAVYGDGRPAPNWGQLRAAKLHDIYSALGYNCTIETPRLKDVNEDLISFVKNLKNLEKEESEHGQSEHEQSECGEDWDEELG